MARPHQNWELALRLEGASRLALFVRLARAISADIQRGRLTPGTRLPGSRELARVLGVHRNTVIAAYRELLAEGYLEAKPGQSTFVAPTLPELPSRRLRPRAAPVSRKRSTLRLPEPAPPVFAPPELPRGAIALYGGLPDLRLLPAPAFARAYRRALRRPGLLGYGDARGYPQLRAALAAMLRASRGLALGEDDLVITRGSQMALALCARTLLSPGDVVAVEALGYRPAWHALLAAGAKLLPIPLDRDGLDVDVLAAHCERQQVRVVYVTPHHQYPTTAALSAPRRHALLALAARHRFAILEDDYDHEFHYDGPPLLPLASADHHGSVVYIGTLSKVLAPGVRIGYVAGPPELLRRVVAHRFYLDRQGDQATECAVAELFEDGEVQRHVRRARRIYHGRRDRFIDLLGTYLADILTFPTPAGGMALFATTEAGLDVELWQQRCVERAVAFQSGQLFDFHERCLPNLRLGFACATEAELETAVARMRRALPGRARTARRSG
jgi:GntR family transcriptional regulator/MocR family aminotransferase